MNCRSCREPADLIADLGRVPLANALAPSREAALACDRHPLRLVHCAACGLLQLAESPPPVTLFRDYPYRTGCALTMVRHLERLAAQCVRPNEAVAEIGSNDGTFLAAARRRGARVLGIDPAEGPARAAARRGLETRRVFFDRTLARALREERGAFDLVVGANVLAHVPDPNEVAGGIATLLAPTGRAVLEVPALDRLVRTAALDTVYHEHHAVFPASALVALFERHGLDVFDLEPRAIHGGSWRAWIAPAGRRAPQPRVTELIASERDTGAVDVDRIVAMVARSDAADAALGATVAAAGTVGGYGAAAKATMRLNRIGLDTARLPWIADVSPEKQGRFVPGTGQRIVPPEELLRARPDLCVVFAWNLMHEIEQSAIGRRYAQGGGRFLPSRTQASAPSASATGVRVSGRLRTSSSTRTVPTSA